MQRVGCDLVQRFLFACPLAPEVVESYWPPAVRRPAFADKRALPDSGTAA
jgi:hypothetical protein